MRILKKVDKDGMIEFTRQQVLEVVRSTKLRSKKIRKVNKRFHLVMNRAIKELLERLKNEKNIVPLGMEKICNLPEDV